jgi:hypothetical protein
MLPLIVPLSMVRSDFLRSDGDLLPLPALPLKRLGQKPGLHCLMSFMPRRAKAEVGEGTVGQCRGKILDDLGVAVEGRELFT